MTILIRIFATALLVLVAATSAMGNRIVSVEPDTAAAQPNVTFVKNFSFVLSDFRLPLKWSVRAVGISPYGRFEMPESFTGRFIFTPSIADSGNTYRLQLTVSDNDNSEVDTEFLVTVGRSIPPVIEIEQTHNTFQGMWEYVSISNRGGELATSSFRIRLCYNGAALRFDTLTFSPKLAEFGWTHKFSNASSIRIGPLGLQAAAIEFVAYCSSKDMAPLPNGELFNLKFLVSNDRTLECEFIPIDFVWTDCSDNAFTSANSDTIFSSSKVVSYDWSVGAAILPGAECQNRNPVSFSGPCPNGCTRNRGLIDVRNIIFKNGGVGIVCSGWDFHSNGDITLNDIPYEIADFDLMSRWLVYGDSVLDVNSMYRQAQINASDANQDGEVPSVADIVYLARVIVGDARPFPKLRPYQQAALIEKRDDTLFVEAYDSIGGVLMLFKAGDETGFENLTGIEMMVGRRGSLTTVLLKPSLADLQRHIPPGRTALVRVKGKCEIQDVEVSTYDGSCMNVRK